MKSKIQKFGKTLMGPLSIIVFSGLFLGIVSILQNPSIVGEGVVGSPFVHNIIGGVNAIVGMMFGLLPILFAISVATGLAKEDKEYAAFAVVIGFFIFHITIKYLLSLSGITPDNTSVEYLINNGYNEVKAYEITNQYDTVYGIFTYRMGIFGGVLVGLVVSIIHNKYHTQKLPVALSFFAGNRFVPIMTILLIPFVSILSYFVWPKFSMLINGIGTIISKAAIFGPFIYGFSERLLIPTGLHHILNQLIRFTPIGGTAVVDGQTVSGALSIFNAALASPEKNVEILRYSTRFLTQGTHAFMVFGLPAACYAMYKTAYTENKEKVKAMLLAAALTSFLTGITEPIEFAFIFISPALWLFHAFMSGLSFLLMTIMNVAVGNAGGGFIDLSIFGILQGTYTRWYLIVLVGIVYAFAYYYVFKYFILKNNIKTPGREDAVEDEVSEEVTLNSGNLGQDILKALGGKDNIISIDNCISRLRLELNDINLINKDLLIKTGALGIMEIDDTNVHVVYGGKVEEAALELKRAYRK